MDVLDAGRLLDFLIAEKLMGMSVDAVPCYSTQMSAAWLIVEHMRFNDKRVLDA